jgi:hypothetical protein
MRGSAGVAQGATALSFIKGGMKKTTCLDKRAKVPLVHRHRLRAVMRDLLAEARSAFLLLAAGHAVVFDK